MVREKGRIGAVCLDHFTVGYGLNDADAIAALARTIKTNPAFLTLPKAADDYEARWENCARESRTVREGFILQTRST
jgi:hypothetical protein